MTRLIILTPKERRLFDAPPRFNSSERALNFTLTNEELKIIYAMRTSTNKIGFILQFCYFKANGKFFIAEQFRQNDIAYASKILGISLDEINLLSYQKKIPTDHRKKVLALLDWQAFDGIVEEKIIDQVKWLTQRQFSPRHVFLSIIDFCWKNKFELPSYNTLATILTNSYNNFESNLICILTNKLTHLNREKLN